MHRLNLYKLQKVTTIVKYGIELECIRSVKRVDKKFIGKWFKDKVVTLGPTFIKIGQFLSTRQDILGKEFCDELKDLQDNVPSFSVNDILLEMQEIQQGFEFIDPNPLASASIGQVHLAKLKTGQEVVVKARRPNISATIKDDFELVLQVLKNAERFINSQRIQELNILFQEYYNILNDEIDFVKEKNNMKKFYKMFNKTSWVKIPKVYDEFCNSNIITMEYAPSIKIDNLDEIDKLNYNRQIIADKLVEAFIVQIIDYGNINLDPHPGNVGITDKGKIVFYDFGMILRLDAKFRENFNSLLFAIYDKDIDLISDIAIRNNFIILNNNDSKPFKKFLTLFLKYIDTLNIEELKNDYLDIFKRNDELNFMLSSKFVMLLRGITILEGVCKNLDPNFKYSRNLDKYIGKLIFSIDSFEKKATKDLNIIMNRTDVDNLKTEIEILKQNMSRAELQTENTINEKNITGIFMGIVILLQLMF